MEEGGRGERGGREREREKEREEGGREREGGERERMDGEREKERERTLYYKDCSLGSAKNLSNN